MAGTTSNYSFPYPTNTDLVRNGASAIQSLADSIDSFISGSEADGKLFSVTTTDVTTSTTTTATTPTNIPTQPNQTTFTTGKSGLFMVIVQARLTAPASTYAFVSPSITGAVTSTADTLRSGTTYSNNAVTASWIAVFDGTPNTSTTINLQVWASGAGTTTITRSHCTVICMG